MGPSSTGAARRDSVVLVVFLALFFAVNLSTAWRYPFPWIDEVYFAEPGVNLATGSGFTSKAWHNAAADEIYAANAPLYSLLLAGWMSIFGAGQFAARSMGIFLTAIAVLLLWHAVRKLGIIADTRWRLWLCALVACDYGYAMAYRGGRPEPLALLLSATMFHAFTQKRRYRSIVLAIGSLLLPFVGLQFFAFGVLITGALLVFFRSRLLREAAVIFAGLLFGLAAFWAIYRALGIWPEFVRELQWHGNTDLIGRVWHRLTTNPLTTHRHTIPKDFSLVFIYAAVVLTTVWLAAGRKLSWSSAGALGLLVAVVVPAGLYYGLAFPTYYSWMVAVPLAVIYNSVWSSPDARPIRTPILVLQAAACLVGLPFQLAVAAYDWRDRNPEIVTRFVSEAIEPGDAVYCDWVAYYAVRQTGAKTYLPMYLKRIEPREAESITIAIVSPYGTPGLPLDAAQQLEALGGGWTRTGRVLQPAKNSFFGNNWQGGFLSLPNYTLEIYRRPPRVSGGDPSVPP